MWALDHWKKFTQICISDFMYGKKEFLNVKYKSQKMDDIIRINTQCTKYVHKENVHNWLRPRAAGYDSCPDCLEIPRVYKTERLGVRTSASASGLLWGLGFVLLHTLPEFLDLHLTLSPILLLCHAELYFVVKICTARFLQYSV